MASSSHHHHHHQRHNLDRQCLLPPPPITKNPKTTTTTTPPPPTTPNPISPSLEDLYLSTSTHLTRQQVLRRRSHNLKQLAKVYTHHYWALMERLRAQYRDYVWRYGLSPFKEDEEREGAVHNDAVEGSKETRADSSNFYCAFYGCRLKAMALTSFCQLHILSDSRQQLYKPCEYVIKGAQAGPITCGKPILRATVPSLCHGHFQKAQMHVTRALKKAGLNISSSSKLAPKFHVIVTEYVREIQRKRRAALGTSRSKVVFQHRDASCESPDNGLLDLENMREKSK